MRFVFNNRPNKIVAELTLKQNKRDLIQVSRKSKLTCSSIDVKWENYAIYINDNLTQFNWNAFCKTKAYAYAQEFGCKFVWFKDSKLGI